MLVFTACNDKAISDTSVSEVSEVDKDISLKLAFENHFLVGTAVNEDIGSGKDDASNQIVKKSILEIVK